MPISFYRLRWISVRLKVLVSFTSFPSCAPLSRLCFSVFDICSLLEDQNLCYSGFCIKLFWRTRDLGYLVESIMILEFGLAIRRLEKSFFTDFCSQYIQYFLSLLANMEIHSESWWWKFTGRKVNLCIIICKKG